MASDDPEVDVVPRTLSSPSIVKAELYKRLTEDGLHADCSEEEKLLYVWRLLQQTEKDLQVSVTTEEKLRQSQAEEMEEVENYVEHIRNLSDERETLIQELESENEQLKTDIETLKQDTDGAAREETQEMLVQQGLEEVTNSSVTEQIAFLLVERARLLDELEAEQNKSLNYSGVEGQLDQSFVRNLEDENGELKRKREELLEEIKTQSDNQETLIKSLEDKINKLNAENTNLSQQLSTIKTGSESNDGVRKRLETECEELKQEREDLLEQLDKHRKAEEYQKRVHDEEITTLMEDNDKCEEDLAELRQKVQGLEEELKQTKSEMVKEQEVCHVKAEPAVQATPLTTRPPSPARTNSDLALRKIIVEKTQIESEMVSLRSRIKPLETEKESLETKISELEASLTESQMLNHSLQMKNKSLQSELQDTDNTTDSLQRKIDRVLKERDDLEKVLSCEKSDNEKIESDYKDKLNLVQQKFDEIRSERSMLEREYQEKQNKLNSQISELKISVDNLTSEKEELIIKIKGLNSELEEFKSTSEQGLSVQTSKLEAVTKERQKLYNQLQEAQRELKQTQTSLTNAEKEITETAARVKDAERKTEITVKDFKQVEKELKETQNKEKQLIKEKEILESSLQNQTSRLSQDSEDLKTKLQLTLAELTKTRNSVDELNAEKRELQTQIKDLENVIEDNIADHESTVNTLQSKVKSLESQRKSLEEDLLSSQDEREQQQQQFEQTLESVRSQRSTVESDLNGELNIHLAREETLVKEKAALEKAKAELHQNLEKNTTTVVGLQKTLDGVYKERDDLQVKVTSLEQTLQQEKGEKLKQLESMQKERDSYKDSMNNIQITLQGDNQEKNNLISELRSERDQLKRDLERVQKSTKHEDEERSKYLERIRSMEEISKQLEDDNRELAQQLSEKLNQCQHLDDQMRKEKNRQIGFYKSLYSTDEVDYKLDKSHEEIQRLHVEIDTANERIRQLREEGQSKQTLINKLEMEAVSQEAKHETAVHKLELAMNDLRLQHRKEIDTFSEKQEGGQREVKELMHQLRDKDQEMIRYQHEANRAKTVSERLDTQLQSEIKQRSELENKNTVLEHDLSKVFSQVKSLMEKLNNVENSKKSLEEELDRKCNLSRESNDYHSRKLASQSTELTTLRSRAELAEHKVEKLQTDLSEAIIKLQSTEKQMFENSLTRTGYQDKQGEVTEMRRSLHDTQIQKTILEQTVHEMKHQINILKQREVKLLEQNRDLQHTMIDMESKVNQMRERAQHAIEQPTETVSTEKRDKCESGKRGLGDQISRLRREIESLQNDLITAHEKRDIWERRYEERKSRTKSKLLKAREFYSNERNKLKDQLVKIGDDLEMTRATLNKELEWRIKMEDSQKSLLSEKRDLLTQLSEREETCRDLNRQLSMTGVRLKHQEEENTRLQESLRSLSQQKQNLDKTVKEFQLDRHKEMLLRALSPDPNLQSLTAATSGLGNSMDSSWDPDHLAESTSHLPTIQQESPLNNYFLHNLRLGRSDFDGSERSYDLYQEYEA